MLRFATIFLSAAVLSACATTGEADEERNQSRTLTESGSVGADDRAPKVTQQRAEECAPQILAVGSLSQGQAPAVFERSRVAYGNAASWVTYYRAEDATEGIDTVLREQTQQTQERAREVAGQWAAAAREGTPVDESMRPALSCIAEFSLVGLPPQLPGTD